MERSSRRIKRSATTDSRRYRVRRHAPQPEDPEPSLGPALSTVLHPVFSCLKTFGFYAHDPSHVPKAYEGPLATFYAALLITLNIFLFAFHISAVERSVWEEGLWRIPTTSLVIAAIRPIHCAFNLGLFRRGYAAHQQFWQQTAQIDQFLSQRLQVSARANRIKYMFLFITGAILFAPFCLGATQIAFLPSNSTLFYPNWSRGDCLALVFAPVQCLWQLLPLVYYAHVGYLFLCWYRALHFQVETDWENYGRLRRRPLEFYSRQYTKLTEAVFAVGQFFHPIIFFSLAHSIVVLGLAVYFMKNAAAFFEDNTLGEEGRGYWSLSKKAYGMAWTALQIMVAFVYVLTICFMRWQLKLRACTVAASILSHNRKLSREFASIRESNAVMIDRRRQWRRRCRSECQHDRMQPMPATAATGPPRLRFRRFTILAASPRPILPSVWSSTSTRRRDNRGSTYL